MESQSNILKITQKIGKGLDYSDSRIKRYRKDIRMKSPYRAQKSQTRDHKRHNAR